ncbi:MAG: hypothetical protein JTT11_00460 [Candidatus Brockarchaeota archaeon]|nr:hypothetical protein [Candidatus Brockarchaeota archaeon]
MDILFLGTAAAEGYPGAFCRCRKCLKARREGGRSLRKRSAIVVDGELLVDMPPDLYSSAISHKVGLFRLRSVLVTHSHSDHFSPGILEFRKRPFAFTPLPKLALFCDEPLLHAVESAIGGAEGAKLEPRPVYPFEDYGSGRHSFTPIPANHSAGLKGETPLNYIIERGGKRILYASDTGPYGGEVLDFLLKKRFDAIIVECTMGSKFYERHMNYESVLGFHELAKGSGALKEGGRFITTHFAHDGCGTYPEVKEFFRPHGIEVAYDGMLARI